MKVKLVNLILVLLIVFPNVKAELIVRKIVENENVKTGDYVNVLLGFTNPFTQDIKVKIVDKNILGNSGVDIQCLEYVVPPGNFTLVYEPIPVFNEGIFTLKPAEVSYINPKSNKVEKVYSNNVTVKVEEGVTKNYGYGITTIYQCGGSSIRTSSYGSGSSFSISVNPGFVQIQQEINKIEKEFNKLFKKQRNLPMAQNMKTLKKEIQKELQRALQENKSSKLDKEKEEIQVQKEKVENKNDVKHKLWSLLILIVLSGLVYYILHKNYILHKKKQKENVVVIKKEKSELDNIRMIKQAQQIFGKNQKEAYALVAKAIRLFYAHKFNIKKEVTNTELIELVKQHKLKHKELKNYLELCSLVEFAKYKPKEEEFLKLVEFAKRLFKS